MRPKLHLALCALAVSAALAAAPALAAGPPDHQLLGAISGERIGLLEQFKGACGVAVDSAGDVYVADYYQNRIVVFDPEWDYLTQILGVEPLDAGGVKPIDGPCDLAVGPAGALYVNSYHGAVRRYLPAAYPPAEGTSYGARETIDPGPVTGIAVDRQTGDLYADRRTEIARYEAPVSPSDEPAQEIGAGDLGDGYGVAFSGFEGDSQYASTKGRLYVADAASGTVKAYDPAVSATDPVQEIRGEGTAEGGFHFEDADVEVDPTDGHLYLSNDLEPHFEERPELVVDEFSPAGYYRGSVPANFLNGFPSFLQAGEPSGLAIANAGPYAGDLFVTSGNWEGAAVYVFGPPAPAQTHLLEVAKAGEGTVTSIPAAIACGPVCVGEFDAETSTGGQATVVLKAIAANGSSLAGWSGCDSEPTGLTCAVGMGADRVVGASFEPAPAASSLAAAGNGGGAGAAARVPVSSKGHGPGATLVRNGNLQVALRGRISPRALPRRGTAPIAVSLGGDLSTTDGSQLPQLKRLRIELNRGGRLDTEGLPSCPLARIAIATSDRALGACRDALVGRGRFAANIVLRGQEPYPSTGRLLVFNSTEHGRPVLYGHIYSSVPFATSFVIRFAISHRAHGHFGTVLSASLPEALGDWGYVTAIQLRLSRRYRAGGRTHSYISAGCAAPKGFPGALFALARTSFTFAGGKSLRASLTRECRVR